MANAETRFICADGGIQVNAEDTTGESSITVYHRGQSEVRSFKKKKSPFGREAEAFLETIESRNHGRNPPADALLRRISCPASASRLGQLLHCRRSSVSGVRCLMPGVRCPVSGLCSLNYPKGLNVKAGHRTPTTGHRTNSNRILDLRPKDSGVELPRPKCPANVSHDASGFLHLQARKR